MKLVDSRQIQQQEVQVSKIHELFSNLEDKGSFFNNQLNLKTLFKNLFKVKSQQQQQDDEISEFYLNQLQKQLLPVRRYLVLFFVVFAAKSLLSLVALSNLYSKNLLPMFFVRATFSLSFLYLLYHYKQYGYNLTQKKYTRLTQIIRSFHIVALII